MSPFSSRCPCWPCLLCFFERKYWFYRLVTLHQVSIQVFNENKPQKIKSIKEGRQQSGCRSWASTGLVSYLSGTDTQDSGLLGRTPPTFVALVVVHLPGGANDVLLALQHRQEALVDADVLLLRLHHPNALWKKGDWLVSSHTDWTTSHPSSWHRLCRIYPRSPTC